MTQRLLQDFADVSSEWFWEMDADLRFSFVSDRFHQASGLDPADCLGKTRAELSVAQAESELWNRHLEDLAARRPFRNFIYTYAAADGSMLRACISGKPFFDEAGTFLGYRGVGSIVNRQHKATEDLQRRNAQLLKKEAMLEQVERMASVGSWDCDLATRRFQWSDEVYRIFDLPRDKAPSEDLILGAFPEKLHAEIKEKAVGLMKDGGRLDHTYQITSYAGHRKWVRWIAETQHVEDRAIRAYGIFQDVTAEREHGAVIKRMAHTDALTGLSNRTIFQEKLREFRQPGAEKTGGSFALFLIDIDHFKHVNDFYGHDAGDKVLRFAAHQLGAVFGETAVIARLGGDEMAVIKPFPQTGKNTGLWAEAIRKAFGEPVAFHGNSIEVTVSIGIALAPEHGASEHDIMRAADLALYRSKHLGRNRATVYDEALSTELDERSATLTDFNIAAGIDQIVPYFQPIVDLRTGRHLGFEALMRWKHPSRGVLAPGEFASVFEDPRSARVVTGTMLSAVADQAAEWRENSLPAGKISLNLTGVDLRDDRFLDTLCEAIRSRGLTPQDFVIEVTENVIFGDREQEVIERICNYSSHGFEIALDDFGTGFASLTHLQLLPVDIVKIDRSFMMKPDLSAQDLAILKAVIELGNALSFLTVAEGIEEEHQCRILRLMGCDRGQGYYFSKPIQATDVPTYLLENFIRTEIAGETESVEWDDLSSRA